MRKSLWPLLMLISLACLPGRSEAAIFVEEVGAQLVHTAHISVQSTITAVQSINQVLNQILELTGIEGLVLDGGWVGDVQAIGEIIALGQVLVWDLASLEAQIEALFGLEGAPNTAVALNERMSEIRVIIFQSYSYAMRAQVLMQTAFRTVQHLVALVERIGEFIGNMQANQTLAEKQAQMVQILSEQKVTTAALHRAQATEALQGPMVIESLRKINEAMMVDHPR
jgi:hypothetical protein